MDFDDLDAKPGCRLYDIVVYGCTGITGCLIVEHLDELLMQDDAPTIKWAIAGRNEDKLKRMAKLLKSNVETMRVETKEDLEFMAESTSVVIAAAGPYLLVGGPVVDACVKHCTHYLDVTGEIVYNRRMIDQYHAKAKEKGIMIVIMMGYMCAAMDLHLFQLAQKLGPLKLFREYNFSPAGVRGGGSFFSGYSQFENMNVNEPPLLINPFSLGGARKCPVRKEDKDAFEAYNDEYFPNVWCSTGFTGHPGVRVSRRTCELYEQGPEGGLQLGENIIIQSCDVTFSQGQAKMNAQMAKPPEDIRKIMKNAQAMENGLLDGSGGVPGQGAPRATRKLCRSEGYAIAQGEDGTWAYSHFDGPEGYEFSAISVVCGALTFVLEDDAVNAAERGGVVTPGYAFHGTSFLERLQQYGWACKEEHRTPKYTLKDGMLPEKEFEDAVRASEAESKAFQKRLFSGELKTSEKPELITWAHVPK